jgi:hypothetical protein
MRIPRSMQSAATLTLTIGLVTIVGGVSSAANAAAETPASLAHAATQGAQSPASTDCQHNIAITSLANGKFVSAELGYTGGNYAMLRARAATPESWETFK